MFVRVTRQVIFGTSAPMVPVPPVTRDGIVGEKLRAVEQPCVNLLCFMLASDRELVFLALPAVE